MEPKEAALELLKNVENLARQGYNQKQIAEKLSIKTTFTLNNRLVKASQQTGHPVPPFKQGRKHDGVKSVEYVEVKRRGKGDSFGANVPMEPLVRARVKPGDRLRVSVRGRTISLTRED